MRPRAYCPDETQEARNAGFATSTSKARIESKDRPYTLLRAFMTRLSRVTAKYRKELQSIMFGVDGPRLGTVPVASL